MTDRQGDLKEVLIPVSYTHLDVYKRQSKYSVFKITNTGKRNEYISGVNAYAAYMTTKQAEQLLKAYAEQGVSWQEDVVSAFLNANNSLPMFAATNIPTLLTPVSYTHLDVYKRQSLWCHVLSSPCLAAK